MYINVYKFQMNTILQDDFLISIAVLKCARQNFKLFDVHYLT